MSEIERKPTFVDTHAHLSDEQFAADAGAVIARASALGVRHIVNVGFSQRMWEAARHLAGANPGVSFTLGIHPNSAGEWSSRCGDELERLVDAWRPSAVGESGLDYYWNAEPRDVQLTAFRSQLSIARSAGLPVIIHMRGDVEADIRASLPQTDQPMCVFHSFDGSAELAAWIIERGWMIGAGGLMTRRSARGLQEILRSVPDDQLLLETDSPYLSPSNWSEKRNTPESIPLIAGHLANVRQTTVASIAQTTTANAARVFGFADVAAFAPVSGAGS
ncbi:MAG: TatD family hydrolase [Thermomicrobiales bacterium]|nr:TatD family hydrolase [Thermomicrobiales bacterium]